MKYQVFSLNFKLQGLTKSTQRLVRFLKEDIWLPINLQVLHFEHPPPGTSFRLRILWRLWRCRRWRPAGRCRCWCRRGAGRRQRPTEHWNWASRARAEWILQRSRSPDSWVVSSLTKKREHIRSASSSLFILRVLKVPEHHRQSHHYPEIGSVCMNKDWSAWKLINEWFIWFIFYNFPTNIYGSE